jgi:hypothetical protein
MERQLDTARCFEDKNLLTFSNVLRPTFSPSARECNATLGEVPCLEAGCVLRSQLCDGKADCEDGYDESGCKDNDEETTRQLQQYKLSRYVEMWTDL